MGGQEYFKYDVCFNPRYEVKKINIDASVDELYSDWHHMEDKYGLVQSHCADTEETLAQVF